MNNNINNNEHFTENEDADFSSYSKDFSFFGIYKEFSELYKNSKHFIKEVQYKDQDVINSFDPNKTDVNDIHDKYMDQQIEKAEKKITEVLNNTLDQVLFEYQNNYYEIKDSKNFVKNQCRLKKSLQQIHPKMDQTCNLRSYYRFQELKSLIKQRIKQFSEKTIFKLDQLEKSLEQQTEQE